jgi:hypothetical protein
MARRILNADAPLPERRRSFYGAEPDRFRRHGFHDTVPEMHPSRICSNCGYDLVGIDGARCPECGGEIALVAITLSPRALRWSRRKRLWLGVPAGVFAVMLFGWCWLLDPATGHGIANVGSFVGAFGGVFFVLFMVHAIAWAATSGDSDLAELRGRLWWLTLPALHVWWLFWPLAVIVGLRITSALGVDGRTQVSAFYFWSLGIAPLMPLITWRMGWWLISRHLRINIRPGVGAWVAAGVIGAQAGFILVMMVSALATIDV